MSTVSVAFGGLTFLNDAAPEGDGSLWVLEKLSGWGGGAEVVADRSKRSRSHGEFGERAYRGAAVIVVDGSVVAPSRSLAVAAKRRMEAALADGTYSDVTVVDADEGELSASVRLAVRPSLDWLSSTALRVQFQLYQPDSVRYGPLVATSSGFPEMVGGLRYDLYTNGAGTTTGWLDYGDPSITGHLSLANVGTAPSWPQFQVAGPVDAAGFEIVTVGSGARVRFEGAVPLGSVVVIDAASGVAMIDGVADRGGLLTWRDWTPVPAAGSVEFAFVPLGTPMGAVLTASARPAYW